MSQPRSGHYRGKAGKKIMTIEANLNNYRDTFSDVCFFLKNHLDAGGDGGYWGDVISDADMLYRRYSGSRLARDLVQAAIGELERIGRNKGT